MCTLYIKFELGITHFAHNYMELNLTYSLQTKAFKTLALSDILHDRLIYDPFR